jgi:hypothetical protein
MAVSTEVDALRQQALSVRPTVVAKQERRAK